MAREFDFYIVPTPIGNIKDITLRAIEVLKSVDLIACEDTRTTQKLLNHYDIKTKCFSYHKYNERERVGYFLQELSEGKKIALVSDAGTPMICDPGAVIVSELTNAGYSITALPGACAVTTFLSEIPRIGEEFAFIGFMPRGEKQIEDVCKRFVGHNFVFYESPERIIKTLKTIRSVRGNVKIALGRELSKLFEEIVVDEINDVIEHFNDGIKGEIVCMVYADSETDKSEMDFQIKELKSKGFKDKEISVILSTLCGFNKNEVYKKSLEM
ncbi:16S rRNA (cytidine(1402)-2'-O)-methyltransferase [bacterium]|nr:16S rRNA (cytidine(1402)-2'-O)-methyltransferase [bacterium]